MNLKAFRFLKRSKVVLPIILILGLSTTSARLANDEVQDRRTVLIIPYSPVDYRAVGGEFICTTCNISPGELSSKIRGAITTNTLLSIVDYYRIPAKIISETPRDGNPSDYMRMQNIIGSTSKWKRLLNYDRLYPRKILNVFSGAEHKFGSDCLNGGGGYPSNIHSYYKTIILDTDKFVAMTIKYHVGYVLFLNHFELNTRFRNCLDMYSTIYQRDFFLHYTLYDNGGLFLSGGTVGITCQDNSNDYKEVLEDNLEFLTDMVCSRVKKYLL